MGEQRRMRAGDVEVVVLDRDYGDGVLVTDQVVEPQPSALTSDHDLTFSPLVDGTGVMRAMGLPARVTT